jgi:hypothetical protein
MPSKKSDLFHYASERLRIPEGTQFARERALLTNTEYLTVLAQLRIRHLGSLGGRVINATSLFHVHTPSLIRLECCAHQLSPPRKADIRRSATAEKCHRRYCYVKVVSEGFVEATVLSGSLFRHARFAKTLIELLDMGQGMVGPREGSPLGDGSAFGTNSAR